MTVIAPGKRAYIDTSLLLPYVIGPSDSSFPRSRAIFADAEQGRYRLVISHFALQETLHALRRTKLEDLIKASGIKKRQQLQAHVSRTDFLEKAKQKTWEVFRKIVDQVTADEVHFEVDGRDNYDSHLFVNGLDALSKTFGYMKLHSDKCQFCEGNMECIQCYNEIRHSYKAVNAPDVTHTSLAIALGCDELLTADHGFKELQNQGLPINIRIIA